MRSRRCNRCGMDISYRGNRATCCEDCQREKRQMYWQLRQHKRIMQPGTADPFRVRSYGCGKNKNGQQPRSKTTWMHFWANRNGALADKYTIERDKATVIEDDTFNNVATMEELNNPTKTKKPTRKERYDGWEY